MHTPNNSIGKAYLTLQEAALFANCSSQTIRRAVRARALPHHRYGTSETRGKIFISAVDLEAWLFNHRQNAIGE